jgi:hypothetical protein
VPEGSGKGLSESIPEPAIKSGPLGFSVEPLGNYCESEVYLESLHSADIQTFLPWNLPQQVFPLLGLQSNCFFQKL